MLDDFRHKLDPSILEGLEEFEKTFQRRFMQPEEPLYSSFKVIQERSQSQSHQSTKKFRDLDGKKFMEELKRPPAAWEVNPRCIRSIKHRPG